MLIFLNKGDNHQKWKTINLQHGKEAEKEKSRQASKLGMSTSKVDCCFFCLKMKAAINQTHNTMCFSLSPI